MLKQNNNNPLYNKWLTEKTYLTMRAISDVTIGLLREPLI